MVELHQKVQQHEFGDILICGITNLRLREHFLREPNMDLQKTIQIGQNAEETRCQSKMLNATSKTWNSEISAIQFQHNRKGAKTQRSHHVHSRHHNEEDGSERKPAKNWDAMSILCQ